MAPNAVAVAAAVCCLALVCFQPALSARSIFVSVADSDQYDADDITAAKEELAKDPETAKDYDAPLIRCFCNLPACLEASGGVQTCTTRLGCFSEIQPLNGGATSKDSSSTLSPVTTSSTTTAVPIPKEFDEQAAASELVDESVLRATYGCLELMPTPPVLNKTCNEILTSMEDHSEFPALSTPVKPANGTDEEPIRAYHCCQSNMCNDITHVAAAAPAAQAALATIFQQTMDLKKAAAVPCNATAAEAPTAENATATEPDVLIVYPASPEYVFAAQRGSAETVPTETGPVAETTDKVAAPMDVAGSESVVVETQATVLPDTVSVENATAAANLTEPKAVLPLGVLPAVEANQTTTESASTASEMTTPAMMKEVSPTIVEIMPAMSEMMSTMSEMTSTVTEGTSAMTEGTSTVTEGTSTVTAEGTSTTLTSAMTEGTSAMTEGTSTTTTSTVTEETSIMTEKTSITTEETSIMTKGTSIMTEGTSIMTEGTSIMTEGTSIMTEGTSIMTEGTSIMTEGTSIMTEGTSTVTEKTSTVTEGTSIMTEGTSIMTEGTSAATESVSTTTAVISATTETNVSGATEEGTDEEQTSETSAVDAAGGTDVVKTVNDADSANVLIASIVRDIPANHTKTFAMATAVIGIKKSSEFFMNQTTDPSELNAVVSEMERMANDSSVTDVDLNAINVEYVFDGNAATRVSEMRSSANVRRPNISLVVNELRNTSNCSGSSCDSVVQVIMTFDPRVKTSAAPVVENQETFVAVDEHVIKKRSDQNYPYAVPVHRKIPSGSDAVQTPEVTPRDARLVGEQPSAMTEEEMLKDKEQVDKFLAEITNAHSREQRAQADVERRSTLQHNLDNILPSWVVLAFGISAVVAMMAGGIWIIMIIKKTAPNEATVKIIDNYKGKCSNPGVPCACTGWRGRRPTAGRQTVKNSVNPRLLAVAMGPVLPARNKPYTSIFNDANLRYIDDIGDSPYNYTRIPVPPPSPTKPRRNH